LVVRNPGTIQLAILLIAFSLTTPRSLRAAPPATTQSTQIQHWFDNLADADPAVRDDARIALMGLNRPELATLRDVVEKNRPLAASQLAALHDIVVHVFLATEPYEKENGGFLGVRPEEFQQTPVGASEDDATEVHCISGVRISEIVPGFCANRYLRENDIVIGVVGKQYQPTQDYPTFIKTIAEIPPGETVTLEVLRQGRVARVSLPLDARPHGPKSADEMREWNRPRLEAAEAYWKSNFASLVPPGMS
jgi:hypothetical protein